MSITDSFRTLHESGFFLIPNPWDAGSARALEEMGFRALATTSSGLGRSLGKDDHEVTRDELVRHLAELTAVVQVPINVDSERLFPDDPGGISETVRLLADAGAAGCSVEDYQPATGTIDDREAATDAVAAAASACSAHGLVLTARAENFLYRNPDIEDTIARLIAYHDAGAEVLYAPGLAKTDDIARIVTETGAPINVLLTPRTPPLADLASLGVRRVSTGGALHGVAMAAMRARGEELLGFDV